MSTETPDLQDRSLARRFNFLGFPGEKRAGVSYADLRTELGDENAAALVTKVGTLLQSQGLDKLGVPLHDAVDRIVQSLTADERRTIAQGGGMPPHVQTQISAEITAAKMQQLKATSNTHGPGAGMANPADGGLGMKGLRSLAAQGTSASGSSASYDGISGKLSTAASNPEFLKSLGLDYGTASKLAGLGFTTPEQVRQIAHDANTLGLAPKAAAVDIAKLRKAEGKDADQHIKTLGEYGKSHEDIERERKAEEAKPDSPEKKEHLRILEQRRKELEQQTDTYEHNQVHTPEGKKQFHKLREMTKDEASLRARVGVEARRRAHDNDITSKGKHSPRADAVSQDRIAAKDQKQDQKAADASFDAMFSEPTKSASDKRAPARPEKTADARSQPKPGPA